MKFKWEKLILLYAVISITAFIFLFLSGNLFAYGYDARNQAYPFYTEYRRLYLQFFTTGSLPFYSFNLFLGNSVYSTHAFYGFFDIVNYLTFPLDISYFYIRVLQTMLRIFISMVTFTCFLKYWVKKESTLILGSVAYGLSSWFAYFTSQPNFLTFYAFTPLYFAAIEHFYKTNRKAFFIGMAAFLCITNYYFFFTLSLFTIFYCLYRYYNLNGSFKGVLKSALSLIGAYAIGLLMAMVVLLPSIYGLLGNSRLATGANALFYPAVTYLNLLQAFVQPNLFVQMFDHNAFLTSSYRLYELTLFASSVTSLLLPQIFSDKEKQFKKSTLVLYGVLLLCLLLPLGGSLFHGFAEASFRFTFLVILLNITLACRYLDQPERISKKNLLITISIFTLVSLIAIPLAKLSNTYKLFDWQNLWLPYLIALGAIPVYFLVYWLLQKQKTRILIAFSILEALLFFQIFFFEVYDPKIYQKDFLWEQAHMLELESQGLNQYLDSLDFDNQSSFYRIFTPVNEEYYPLNMNLLYDIKGVTGYNSTNSPALNDLLLFPEHSFDDWHINIEDGDLINFFSVKYVVLYNPAELPPGDWQLVAENYYQGFYIYENLNYRPLGTTYTKAVTYDKAEQNQTLHFANLMDTVFVKTAMEEQEINSIMQSDTTNSFTDIRYGQNQITASLTSDQSSFAVLSLPYDAGWQVTINGTSVKTYQVSGGMLGFGVFAGDNQIEMHYVPQGFYTGVWLSLAGVCLFVIVLSTEIKKGRQAGKLASCQ
ncbi:MAG: YfhO family protein [Erysipelotrichaceae bacterium]|jgi:uncharacterized membrane protein YfhO|nr:YfhO family protein [Erysipelotrichaceae bacterium]